MAEMTLADTAAVGTPQSGTFVDRRGRSELLGLVDRIVGYSEGGIALRGHVEMASLVVPLVISFGDPFEIALGRAPRADDRYASFTSGLFPGHVLINSTGAAECVQIDFTPLGARRFFDLPMDEISGRMVRLEDLGDAEADGLHRRLGEERSWSRRLDLVEEFVCDRLRRTATRSREVQWAYDCIVHARGCVRIGSVAQALDWSRKHLVQRFSDEIGVGPKAVARIVRFNHALAMARRATTPGWAEIAAECGYADQAHLVREFREFAGSSPSVLLKGAASALG